MANYRVTENPEEDTEKKEIKKGSGIRIRGMKFYRLFYFVFFSVLSLRSLWLYD